MQKNFKQLDIPEKYGHKKTKTADNIDYGKEAALELQALDPYKEEKVEISNVRWTWPTDGPYCKWYQYWMLVHCLYYQIFVVSRISFEKMPWIYVVYLDNYMNCVYFIDMIRNFTEPFMRDGRLIINRRLIAVNYIKTWFLFDVYAFYPLAYLRFMSRYEDGSKDNM